VFHCVQTGCNRILRRNTREPACLRPNSHQILQLGAAAFRRRRKAGRPEGEKHSCLTSRLGGCALTAMADPLVTSRITPNALQLARMAATKTGGKQDEDLRRLLEAEMTRVSLTAGRC
jgi:hypothetical protein